MKTDTPWDEMSLDAPTTRTSRAFDNREANPRKRAWVEPSLLPDPEPEDGYVFKWVRTATRGIDDKTNFQKKSLEGWEPVDAAQHPETMAKIDIVQTSGKVERGGLILCKMPAEMAAQRNAHYQRRTVLENEAADQNYLRDNDERMKKFVERRRKTVFGN